MGTWPEIGFHSTAWIVISGVKFGGFHLLVARVKHLGNRFPVVDRFHFAGVRADNVLGAQNGVQLYRFVDALGD